MNEIMSQQPIDLSSLNTNILRNIFKKITVNMAILFI